jgi:hypothetical protein
MSGDAAVAKVARPQLASSLEAGCPNSPLALLISRLEPELDQAADGFGAGFDIMFFPPFIDRRQFGILPAHTDLRASPGGRRATALLFRGTPN